MIMADFYHCQSPKRWQTHQSLCQDHQWAHCCSPGLWREGRGSCALGMWVTNFRDPLCESNRMTGGNVYAIYVFIFLGGYIRFVPQFSAFQWVGRSLFRHMLSWPWNGVETKMLRLSWTMIEQWRQPFWWRPHCQTHLRAHICGCVMLLRRFIVSRTFWRLWSGMRVSYQVWSNLINLTFTSSCWHWHIRGVCASQYREITGCGAGLDSKVRGAQHVGRTQQREEKVERKTVTMDNLARVSDIVIYI